MSNHPRKEQKPDPVRDAKQIGKSDVPMDDPNYHYRIVSKEPETRDRIGYHKEMGYGKVKETDRQIVMACRKDEHEQRQKDALARADRMRESVVLPNREVVMDETTIEVTRGLSSQDD